MAVLAGYGVGRIGWVAYQALEENWPTVAEAAFSSSLLAASVESVIAVNLMTPDRYR